MLIEEQGMHEQFMFVMCIKLPDFEHWLAHGCARCACALSSRLATTPLNR